MNASVTAPLRRAIDAVAWNLRTRGARSWLLSGAWVALIVAGYFLLWRPTRVWLAHEVMAPALAALAEGRSGLEITSPPATPGLDVRGPGLPVESGALRVWIEGGRIMLLPMMILALLFPHRSYWTYPWLYHLALIAAVALAAGLGAAGWLWGFSLYEFIHGYVMMPTTLAFPLLVLLFADPSRLYASRRKRSGASMLPEA